MQNDFLASLMKNDVKYYISGTTISISVHRGQSGRQTPRSRSSSSSQTAASFYAQPLADANGIQKPVRRQFPQERYTVATTSKPLTGPA